MVGSIGGQPGGFAMIIGAILMQNTHWTQVKTVLKNLSQRHLLSPAAILSLPVEQLQQHIRPVGFFCRKAETIRRLCHWIEQQGMDRLQWPSHQDCRRMLLDIPGIGAETVDAILLYGLAKPAFVIDAYTRRMMSRLGLVSITNPRVLFLLPIWMNVCCCIGSIMRS